MGLIDLSLLESRIATLGTTIHDEVKKDTPGLFNAEYYSGKLMEWAMEDEHFKISLFRFVDVFPALDESANVVRHAQEYFADVADRIPAMFRWGMNVDPNSISAKLAAPVISHQIRSMAERFIVGESPKLALKRLQELRRNGFAFTVDLLGEATVGEAESAQYQRRYLELLDTLIAEVPRWKEARPLVPGHRGDQTPINVSVKLSALYSQSSPLGGKHTVAILVEQLSEILLKAQRGGASVFIDMEDTSCVSMTIDVVKHALSNGSLKDYDRCGFVLQAYLRRTESDIADLISWVKHRGVPIGIRLVKGAYWDTEVVHAEQQNWAVPVWQRKRSTDANYERIALRLLENVEILHPAFASHNLRTLAFVAAAAELLKVQSTLFEFQALYGMAEPVKNAFRRRGFLVRDYAPVGSLLPGMSYLVRRLLENTSNEGFLRQTFREHETPAVLLRTPTLDPDDTGDTHVKMDPRQEFYNLSPLDFSLEQVMSEFSNALSSLGNELKRNPIEVRPVIAGEPIETQRKSSNVSPSDLTVAVSTVHLADLSAVDTAVANLKQGFLRWRDTSVDERAEILFRAADRMESERCELAALIVYESAKPWAEADADVAEAVDFLRYYAHEAKRLFTVAQLGRVPGESNSYFFEPRGVVAVIGPWNFPLAIPCGMFSAALVTGNCAVLKPAEQSSAIAQRLFEILIDAGIPDYAAAFLPGVGEEIGPRLVGHKDVSTIVFTGSKSVGLQIIQSAGVTPHGATHVKRVVAEMGGKNAIIVDDDADLDEAVRGITRSAFGFAGQKCSACSRAIVHRSVYEKFCARLADAVRSILLGPATASQSFLGPVIDDEAFQRLTQTIEAAKKSATVLVEGCTVLGELPRGYYVQPIVFRDVPRDHMLFREEFFGPVLAVLPAESFEAALDLANDSEYGLTGAVFSRSPKHIEQAVREFRVGNLYINRGSTGALVYRQPFGGAKLSGVGSKAGGPDYLHQFVYPRTVSENTLRRGFAPQTAAGADSGKKQ